MTGSAPCDWDGESFCTADNCGNPATHRLAVGLDGEEFLIEYLCCDHAVTLDDDEPW